MANSCRPWFRKLLVPSPEIAETGAHGVAPDVTAGQAKASTPTIPSAKTGESGLKNECGGNARGKRAIAR